MNTELKNAVGATDKEAQYDESAKRLLGQKWILAHILVKTVDTFKGMRPGEVIRYIEGTPQISTVPAEPGLTNQKEETNGRRIVGFNTENGELGEGLVRFDIVFYGSRLISSQKERDFENSNYDDLKQVYSIWICLNMDEKLNIIGQEYAIPIEENLRKDVSVMCNLSQGIKEDGIAIGRAEGEAGLILKMYKNGFSVEQIAAATDKKAEAVRDMIAGKRL